MRFNLVPYILISLLVLVVFGILEFLHINPGSYWDWIIGLLGIWWLLIITILPWNTYFEAKSVLQNAEQSREKNIPVNEKNVNYAQKIAKKYLIAAISLHVISAVGLLMLSLTGITRIGYVGSVLALLLTFLRPLMRMREFVSERLAAIRNELKFPREDVVELLKKVNKLQEHLTFLESQLNVEKSDSLISEIKNQLESLKNENLAFNTALLKLKAENAAEHQKLSHKSEEQLSQLSEDTKFLNQVREIIRFF